MIGAGYSRALSHLASSKPIRWGTVHDTVDGRNPAPVDMVNIPLFTRFFTSQVVQDFFHQQYCINH